MAFAFGDSIETGAAAAGRATMQQTSRPVRGACVSLPGAGMLFGGLVAQGEPAGGEHTGLRSCASWAGPGGLIRRSSEAGR